MFLRSFSGDIARHGDLCDNPPPLCNPGYDREPETNLYTVPVQNVTASRLTDDRATPDARARWRRRGPMTRIAAMTVTSAGCPDFTVTDRLNEVLSGGASTSVAVDDPSDIRSYDYSPDGQRLAVETESGTTVFDAAGGSAAFPDVHALQRWSPDGNGLIVRGCATERGQERCGLVEHELPDPDGDRRGNDPADHYIGPDVDVDTTTHVAVNQSLKPIDFQAQQLPIVFLPGFLGSEITCSGEVAWAPESLSGVASVSDRFAKLGLDPDGKSNSTCPDAGPNGKPVRKALGSDVYDSTVSWLEANAPGTAGRPDHAVLGWDWRRSEQDSIDKLDAKITARCPRISRRARAPPASSSTGTPTAGCWPAPTSTIRPVPGASPGC